MSNEKIYELLEKMYIEFTNRLENIDSRFEKVDSRFESLEKDISEVKSSQSRLETRMDKLEIRLETEVIDKVRVLFDGYQLHTEQLNRIEEKIGTHEEIIFKRIK